MRVPGYYLRKRILLMLAGTVLFTLQSCTVFKVHNQSSGITTANYKELSGLYNNLAFDDDIFIANQSAGPGCVSRTLWKNTFGCLNKNRELNDTSAQVRLEWQKRGKIKLTLEDNGEILRSRIVRGRIRDGHFVSQQHFVLYPLFPLIFGYNAYRFQIGFSDGKLHLDSKGSYWAFALFGGGDGKGEYTTEYLKVK